MAVLADPAPDPDWKNLALRWLARRDISQAELAERLAVAGASRDTIATLQAAFLAEGWLCDARLAESLVRKYRPRHAEGWLRDMLTQRGLSSGIIESTLATYALAADVCAETPRQQAERILQEKFGPLPAASTREAARRVRFLQQRGFDETTIEALVRESASGTDMA